MPDTAIPPGIRKAAHAAAALPLAQACDTPAGELIDLALNAAAPLIAAAERTRIVAMLDAWKCPCGYDDCSSFETRDALAALILENPDA